MVNVVGVRFKMAGKVYYFDPADLPITDGNKVIVETVRGVEYGEVVVGPKEVDDDQVVQPLKKVIRVGTERDTQIALENKRKEKEAFESALKKIEAHNLDMYLVDVEYTFDGSKIIFYFTAEGRVDFRELVRDLASVFRTRIEMRQIGVRDEAKLLGGIGPCGRVLCCTSFLGDFAPVSIRMAKDQNLSLNPSKISGLCGRLMCCLRYEQETYEAAKKDPTLAPGYVPPVVLESQEPMLEELDEERPAPIIGTKPRPVSGFSARIAQAAAVSDKPEPRRDQPRSDGNRLEGRSAGGPRGPLPEGRKQPEPGGRRDPKGQIERPGQMNTQQQGGKQKQGRPHSEQQLGRRPQDPVRREGKVQPQQGGRPAQDRPQSPAKKPQAQQQNVAPGRPAEQSADRSPLPLPGGDRVQSVPPSGDRKSGGRRRKRRRGPRPEGNPTVSTQQ